MDIQQLIRKHGNVPFTQDGQDEYSVYMCVDDHRMHISKADYSIAEGEALSDILPLIHRLSSDR